MLSQLRDYLSTRKRAAIGDLAVRFDADPDAVRGMLDTWMRKGKVRRVGPAAADCGGCHKCDPVSLEIYEWVG